MTAKLFELGFVLKAVGYLAGTLKKIESVNQLTESLDQGLSGFLNMTQALAVSVDTAKLAGGTAGDSADRTSLAAPPARGPIGETARAGFLEIMTHLSRASQRLGFEVSPGPNRQGIHLLETLDGIQRQFGDMSKHKDLAAAFEKPLGARAAGAIIEAAPAIRAIGLGRVTSIPRALERGVTLLETFAKGIAGGAMWPAHDIVGATRSEHTSGAKRNERASLPAAFGIMTPRAAHIAIENVVTKMRSSLPVGPVRVSPPRGLHSMRIVETIARAIQPAPMFAAIRRVAAVAAVTMPMIIGAAAMPAAGALSGRAVPQLPASFARVAGSPGPGAVVLNYAPHVEVHAPGGDPATLEKAVMEAFEKNRREIYRMLEQVAERRERTRF